MFQLTDEKIINNLKIETSLFWMELIAVAVIFLIFLLWFIKRTKEKGLYGKTGIIIWMFMFAIVFSYCISVFENVLRYNAIKYSIKNDSWYVEVDTVKKTRIFSGRRWRDRFEYIVLSKYGKIPVHDYSTFIEGDSVYAVIVKGRFGGVYVAGLYSTDKNTYEKIIIK